jgi:hypothetical protein
MKPIRALNTYVIIIFTMCGVDLISTLLPNYIDHSSDQSFNETVTSWDESAT